ncbi:hypothetical protein B0H19DRAFT_1085544 [Mycena capillaripes]|nr:hypothetical protein B0H19DRAFT_1085544 [Mycena capillaripes]
MIFCVSPTAFRYILLICDLSLAFCRIELARLYDGSTSNIKAGDPSPKKHNSIWQRSICHLYFTALETLTATSLLVGLMAVKLLMAGLNRGGTHAVGWSQSDAPPTSPHGYQGTHGCQWVKTTSPVQNVDVGNAIHESFSLAQPSAL